MVLLSTRVVICQLLYEIICNKWNKSHRLPPKRKHIEECWKTIYFKSLLIRSLVDTVGEPKLCSIVGWKMMRNRSVEIELAAIRNENMTLNTSHPQQRRRSKKKICSFCAN